MSQQTIFYRDILLHATNFISTKTFDKNGTPNHMKLSQRIPLLITKQTIHSSRHSNNLLENMKNFDTSEFITIEHQ